MDQFRLTPRQGSKGVQLVLPEFTALPLPAFNLLWKDMVERRNSKNATGGTKPEYILIDIEVFWNEVESGYQREESLNIQLRYQSPLSIYAIPDGGWSRLNRVMALSGFPQVVYVPPFSGLEPVEKWLDDGNVRQNVGKGQPGSVLRNLLYRVLDQKNEQGERLPVAQNPKWLEVQKRVEDWFGVKLNAPNYKMGQSTRIEISYSIGRKDFDIISGGSGFHQILTLLAFFYGYPAVTTILFDEPDAHLHVNLQKQILAYFKQQKQIQFLIASHSEEFIRGVEVNSIISMLSGSPRRIQATQPVVRAMREVDNSVVIKTKESPYILYVEGEDDARILTAWAETLGKSSVFRRYHIQLMGGGSKKDMKERAEQHVSAVRQIVPGVERSILFDRDDSPIEPDEGNPVLKEWKRRNMENYLIVPEAWKLAVLDSLNLSEFDLFTNHFLVLIDDFFASQSLVLPKGFSWQHVKANVFEVVDGKRILFENDESLFHQLKGEGLVVNREKVATNLKPEHMHADILRFFDHLEKQVAASTPWQP